MEAALLAAGDGSVAGGDGGGLTTGDTLLIVAQVLFMLLPITGMYTMRAGKPTKLVGAPCPSGCCRPHTPTRVLHPDADKASEALGCSGPKVIIVISAIVAFATLIVMFHLAGNPIGGTAPPSTSI